MYRNLEAEMARNNVSRKDIANSLNVRYATIIDKLKGKYPIKLDEAIKIKNEFFPNFTVEYLFEKESCSNEFREELATKEVV